MEKHIVSKQQNTIMNKMEKFYILLLQFPFFGSIILNVVKIRRMIGGD